MAATFSLHGYFFSGLESLQNYCTKMQRVASSCALNHDISNDSGGGRREGKY